MSNYKYDCILYDFDGTLGDSIPIIMKSFHMAYDMILGGCPRTDEDLMSYIGRPLTDTFEMHDKETSEKLIKAYLETNEVMLKNDEIELFDDVMEVLSEIKSMGIKQGIVTSKMRKSVMVTLELKNMLPLMDIVVSREDTTEHKPNGEPLIYAAGELGISDMSRVLYVGDAVPDGMCANNAGADFCLAGWTRMPMDELMKQAPVCVLKSMQELSCIIKGQQL